MSRLRFGIALLALALALGISARPAHAGYCWGAVWHIDHGTCGWTGEYCAGGNGCLYDCEIGGQTCISWVD